ncbi:MAG: hypothetical protein KKA73_24135 [Chloroflexi bacterium]|nr:hypothetical protein [Chloroflexota bacterium]MBU1750782.1 hypothetical protein [Chloroflexota bacterium]
MPVEKEANVGKQAKASPVVGQDTDGDGIMDAPAGLDANGDGIVDAPATRAGPTPAPRPAPTAAKPGKGMMAQFQAAMQAAQSDIDEAQKTFKLNFDQARFATGTGPQYQEATLADMRAALLQLDAALSTLPVTLQSVREGGYVFDNSLEREIPVINQQWNGTMPRIMNEVLRRGQELTTTSVDVGRRFPWNGSPPEPPEHANAVWNLTRAISSAESDIRGMYGGLEKHIRDVEARLHKAQALLERMRGISFRLQPNEYPVAACAARYLPGASDEEGPNGYLFLTDQRLIFEQNEEVAKAKVLFITTKSEHVQEVKLEVPIGAIKKLEAEDKGFMGHKDFLTMRFEAPPASRPGARFHIQGSNEEWMGLINKIISNEIDSDRVGAKTVVERVTAEAAGGPAAEKMPDIPTNCTSCGAPIHVKVVRGMTSVTCEYCGAQMRV